MPSIRASNWLRVAAFSLWVCLLALARLIAIESISSIKIIAGVALEASSNKSLILWGPTPTKSCWNSEPEVEKKFTPASPATALANKVLPVPGGPYKTAPY